MNYQKYDRKAKVIYWDKVLGCKAPSKTSSTITFRSYLECQVYQWLLTAIDCEVLCQVPIKGDSFTWSVDFMIRSKGIFGKKFLNLFKELLGLGKGETVYLEAKGAITKEFAEKLHLCKKECPITYSNLVCFGDTPLGVVFEEGFLVETFPVRSIDTLQRAILYCNSKIVGS